MELDGETSNLTDGTLTLNFKNATDIEAGRPYIIKWTPDLIISTASEWDAFAESVSNGKTYEGQWVRLTADINVSTMVGSEGHPFKGTFDGSGHTLTVSIEHNNVTEGTALFYSIDGATIRNVKVEGAVTGSFRPATFTSFVGGNSTIKNCWSNVTVKSTVSGNWVDGGAFVARVNTGSTLNMTDCAFTGSIIYNTIVLASAYEGGGMVGWTQDGSTAKLTNCVFAPSSFLCIRSDDNSYVFVSGIVRGELTNCYYNAVAADSYLKHEGTDASEMSSADLLAVLGDGWMVSGDNVVANTSVDIDIVNPMFYDVTIDDSTEALARQTVSFAGGQFVGVYSPVILTPNDASNLFLGADNTLYWPNAANNADGNYYVNACRAYFHIGNGAAVREFRLRFDEDPLTGGGYLGENETTGIIDVEADSSRFTHHSSLSEWYTLDGQKLDGQPTKKGLYIHGKKKVMVP